MNCHFKMLLLSKRRGKSIFCAIDFCACTVSLYLLDHRRHTVHSIPRGFNLHWIYCCHSRSWTSRGRLYFLYARSSMRMLQYVVQKKCRFCTFKLHWITEVSSAWVAENIRWLIWKMKNLTGGKDASDQRATSIIWGKKKKKSQGRVSIVIKNMCKIVQF